MGKLAGEALEVLWARAEASPDLAGQHILHRDREAEPLSYRQQRFQALAERPQVSALRSRSPGMQELPLDLRDLLAQSAILRPYLQNLLCGLLDLAQVDDHVGGHGCSVAPG